MKKYEKLYKPINKPTYSEWKRQWVVSSGDVLLVHCLVDVLVESSEKEGVVKSIPPFQKIAYFLLE